MELRAAIEGLKAVPDGGRVALYTDCTTVAGVYWAWRDGRIGERRGPDFNLWRELADQFGRVEVTVRLLDRGPRDPIHLSACEPGRARARPPARSGS